MDDMIVGTSVGISSSQLLRGGRNLTSGQVVRPDRNWNCTETGLQAHAGDWIVMSIGGRRL
jgi:hypothetical protein